MVGLITEEKDSACLDQINGFVIYCNQHFLELYVKTKEMVIDFRKTTNQPADGIIENSVVERILELLLMTRLLGMSTLIIWLKGY